MILLVLTVAIFLGKDFIFTFFNQRLPLLAEAVKSKNEKNEEVIMDQLLMMGLMYLISGIVRHVLFVIIIVKSNQNIHNSLIKKLFLVTI